MTVEEEVMNPEERPVWRVVMALTARGLEPPYGAKDRRVYRCPSHEDRSPSLSVSEGRDGRALVHCFAGCSVEEVCRALDLTVRDLFVRRGPEPSEWPRFERPRGMLASYAVRFPELGWLIEQVPEDRAYYLDGGEREKRVRAQYPNVPEWMWVVLKR